MFGYVLVTNRSFTKPEYMLQRYSNVCVWSNPATSQPQWEYQETLLLFVIIKIVRYKPYEIFC